MPPLRDGIGYRSLLDAVATLFEENFLSAAEFFNYFGLIVGSDDTRSV